MAYSLTESSSLLVFSFRNACAIITLVRGGIAQLGERLNGIQEVMGSIPTVSTKGKALKLRSFRAFIFKIPLPL